MKILTKLSLITTVAALLGAATSFADDQPLRNRLARQRQAAERDQTATTVAVYSDKGLGRMEHSARPSSEVQLVQRSNPRGQQIFLYAPVK